MENKANHTFYKKTEELNCDCSPYTGAVTCYAELTRFLSEGGGLGNIVPNLFVQISDCHSIIRLHHDVSETNLEAYTLKLRILEEAVRKYREWLEENSEKITNTNPQKQNRDDGETTCGGQLPKNAHQGSRD